MSKKRIMIYVFGILPLLVVALMYGKLPDVIPGQWHLDGSIRYDEKWNLFLIAGVNLFMGIFMTFMAKIDPRKENYAKFMPIYESIILMIEIFMLAMIMIIISESMYPGRIRVDRVIMIMVGLLFIFLGNRMPKIKSNFFTGVKTPWALSSENVWNKTQRLGGKLFFLSGVVLMLGSVVLQPTVMFVVLMVLVVLMCLLPTVMSYVWYQRELKEKI